MYEFEEGMSEISGFGGEYEETCRTMLKAGLEWFDKNPNADPKFHGFEGVAGLCMEDNEDAKKLSDVIVKAANDDCTGAMRQAVIETIFWIRKRGWNEYVRVMKE